MTNETTSTDGLTRRGALTGIAGVGVALPVLAACGSDATTASDPAPAAATTAGGTSTTGAPEAATPLTTTADVPVGSGTIFADEGVVVTQPSEGEFKAFSTTCTHTGCPVTEVRDAEIVCPCHGSHFSITDGSPISGPAPAPLATREITVSGQDISLA